MIFNIELCKEYKIEELVYVWEYGIYEVVFYYFREKFVRSCGVIKEVRCARLSFC